jgi:O-methyltransferase involved in polyketide biosynthesis
LQISTSRQFARNILLTIPSALGAGKAISCKSISKMEQNSLSRDFTSVSPSAKWMILLKGHTQIPYAREMAELLEYPNPYVPDFKKKDYTFWASTLGLERRYRSIDQLLNDISCERILELSSGFSLRCLVYAQQKGVHYVDTDLPDVIAAKTECIQRLEKSGQHSAGKLELLPLNVLDRTNFHEIVGHFAPGSLVIVNEGLLTYLKQEEKEHLCATIRQILLERGGYWITADIALKGKESKLGLSYSDELRQFNAKHDTEANSFESFEEAELFFRKAGFVIDKVATVNYSEMSSFRYFKRSLTLRQLFRMRKSGKVFATWRIKAV